MKNVLIFFGLAVAGILTWDLLRRRAPGAPTILGSLWPGPTAEAAPMPAPMAETGHLTAGVEIFGQYIQEAAATGLVAATPTISEQIEHMAAAIITNPDLRSMLAAGYRGAVKIVTRLGDAMAGYTTAYRPPEEFWIEMGTGEPGSRQDLLTAEERERAQTWLEYWRAAKTVIVGQAGFAQADLGDPALWVGRYWSAAEGYSVL